VLLIARHAVRAGRENAKLLNNDAISKNSQLSNIAHLNRMGSAPMKGEDDSREVSWQSLDRVITKRSSMN